MIHTRLFLNICLAVSLLDFEASKPFILLCVIILFSLGMPKICNLEIEGRGFHTNLYAVRGIYSGGKEGKSKIQWLRSMVGSPDLISIPGMLKILHIIWQVCKFDVNSHIFNQV